MALQSAPRINMYTLLLILRINPVGPVNHLFRGLKPRKTGTPTQMLGWENRTYPISMTMDVPFGCPSIGADLQGCSRAALWSPTLLTCLILTFPFPSVLSMLAKAWPCFPRHSELSGHFPEAHSTPTMMLLIYIHKRCIALFLLYLPSLGHCQCLQHVTVACPSNADKIFPIGDFL